MKKNLVMVESPAKARTLSKILGSGYILKASLGHIRDLPESRLGVDIKNGFKPGYVVPRAKSKIVKELKEAVKKAAVVYLATDPDREGEAISWHLAEVTRTDNTPYHRVVFHEITREAVEQAFQHPRAIDMNLVNAQQARRVLDRLLGYKISPLLWRKVRRGLSAGRVQSVALKIVVDREREIESFVSIEYWVIEAELKKKPAAEKITFRATLVGLATGAKLEINNRQESDRVASELRRASYKVLKVKMKKVVRQPAPPFITSTLQQESWRKLRFSASQTMLIAQQLYEGLPIGNEGSMGLITYMRTDSTHVAHSAVVEAREYIASKFGAKYLPPHARTFARSSKWVQEAHEAIRPTRIQREPSQLKPYLNAQQFKLYELIWKRMLASQMASAIFDSTTVDIEADCSAAKTAYLLRTSTSVNRFPGFIILYIESKDGAEEEEKTSPLPLLEKGNELKLIDLFTEQRFTQPPPRFNEATLVKILEQYGIGRPSTYAPILATIQDREYVTKVKGSFQPTKLGFVVNDMLTKHFADIINVEFTAKMEEELDEIANKKQDWVQVVQDFYTPFEKSLDNAFSVAEKVQLIETTSEVCPRCGKPLVVKYGRYGKFLSCGGYPECKYTQPYQFKTGVKCPKCGKGEIIQKLNKKRRTFYGCSSYPNCDFATNYKPLPQPCPNCGGLLTVYKDKWAKCTKCNYKGKVEDSAKG